MRNWVYELFDSNLDNVTRKDRAYVMPHVCCKDGYIVSIQACEYAYCEPRVNGVPDGGYTSVELGFPNMDDDILHPYAETTDYLTTVYAYVPVEIVNEVLEKHGGIEYVIFEGKLYPFDQIRNSNISYNGSYIS